MANPFLPFRSPSPAASLGSDAMSESPLPSAPATTTTTATHGLDASTPLYPLENQYLSAADRATILALPEIQREEILAERAAEVTKRNQDIQLQKALASAAAAASKGKRKAAAADLGEDGEEGKRSMRPKAQDKGRSALDDYKRARELKGNGERGRATDASGGRKKRRDEDARSRSSNSDADGESEVEWAAEPSSSRNNRYDPPAELADFERCRVGRSNFAKVCFYPNFEQAVVGCFARVSIGVNRETGLSLYRMAQIKGTPSPLPSRTEQSRTDVLTRML